MTACQCHKANPVDYELVLTHKTMPTCCIITKVHGCLIYRPFPLLDPDLTGSGYHMAV